MVRAIGGSAHYGQHWRQRQQKPADSAEIPLNRALVPLHPQARRKAAPAAGRPCSAFLAQLIATVAQAPQTRERRRAEPNEAVSCYACAQDARLSLQRALSRVM